MFIVEGEKDVAALVQAGSAATCNVGGAGKWRKDYNSPFRGADVRIIPDKDQPGRAHARTVASALKPLARSVKVLELPDLNGKSVKDAADYFGAGGTLGELARLFDATPEWEPTEEPHAASPASTDLQKMFGDPVFSREDGTILSINERFFAAHFHARGNLLYEPLERAFYSYAERTGIWRRETDDAVREAVSASVLD